MEKNDPNINKVIFSDYLIQKKIGKGSFGTVYSGIIISTNKKIAFKLESKKGDLPGILETEACRLYLVQGEGIPKIICYGSNAKYNILIQELLGNSLESIFNENGKKFSLKTVCNIGIQMIKRIKHVHLKYHIHRDIKPDNFMTGYHKFDNKIYLIDFGLAKKYYSVSKKQHIKFKDGKSLVGTARYCSRNAHKGLELSRRDDIESIGYVLIYFLKGVLPWQGLKMKKIEEQFNKIAIKKCETTFEKLTENTPDEFLKYFKYCDGLQFEEEPNYEYLIELFKNMINKYCKDVIYDYDWKKKIKKNINTNKSNINNINYNHANSKDISLLVNNNNASNNISAIDSKGDNENLNFDIKEENPMNNININNEIEISDKTKEKTGSSNDIINGQNNENNIKIKKEQNNDRFLPPKQVEDLFNDDFKMEEMSKMTKEINSKLDNKIETYQIESKNKMDNINNINLNNNKIDINNINNNNQDNNDKDKINNDNINNNNININNDTKKDKNIDTNNINNNNINIDTNNYLNNNNKDNINKNINTTNINNNSNNTSKNINNQNININNINNKLQDINNSKIEGSLYEYQFGIIEGRNKVKKSGNDVFCKCNIF